MKGFALGLALKQRRKATRKSPINLEHFTNSSSSFCVATLMLTFHVCKWAVKVEVYNIHCVLINVEKSAKQHSNVPHITIDYINALSDLGNSFLLWTYKNIKFKEEKKENPYENKGTQCLWSINDYLIGLLYLNTFIKYIQEH